MDLKCGIEGAVKCKLHDYVNNMNRDFPYKISGNAKTRAEVNICQVDKKSPKVSEAQAWTKLLKLIKNLKQSANLFLTLIFDKLNVVKSYFVPSCGIHDDETSHAGKAVKFGIGMNPCGYAKQDLNLSYSTDAELMALCDKLPDVLWINYFLRKHGFEVENIMVYQDNKSPILLEVSGRLSATKKTKHTQAKYFFTKDIVEHKEVNFNLCPTDDMVPEFFTESLQGNNLFEFYKTMINYQE